MKIIILHGDDSEKSYARLTKFIDIARTRSWEVAYIDESSQTFTEILSATSLFGGEQFFILKDVKKLTKKEFVWLNKKYNELSGNLIVYNGSSLNATTLKSFPADSKIEEFKLPVLLWNFLDNLVPGNSNLSIKTLHKIVEKQAVEFVFSLIARHFKDLYWVKVDAGSGGFPFWKVNKLKSQASKYTVEKLKELMNILAEIDVEVKTSKADLLSELDLVLIKHLE
jgi:hypothetical protein